MAGRATAIESNTSMLGLHYRMSERAHVVVEHIQARGFALPGDLVFISSGDGRAANHHLKFRLRPGGAL